MSQPHRSRRIPAARALLALLAALVLSVAVASPALGASSGQAYKVSFRGDQTTSWKYGGQPVMGGAGCSDGRKLQFHVPTDGGGVHHLSFHLSKPAKAYAYPYAGRKGDALFSAGFNVTATSTVNGSYTEHWSQVVDCQGHPLHEDRKADASACGETFSWKLSVALKYNVGTQSGRFYVLGQGVPSYNPNSVFAHWGLKCPFFAHASGDYMPLPTDDNKSWDTSGQGLHYTYASVHGRKLLHPRGKTIVIARSASKHYSVNGHAPNDADNLSGETTTNWTASLKPVRR